MGFYSSVRASQQKGFNLSQNRILSGMERVSQLREDSEDTQEVR